MADVKNLQGKRGGDDSAAHLGRCSEMQVKWREATTEDIGRLARFADRKGDDWTYGFLDGIDAQEHVYECVSTEDDPPELFLFCDVQDVIPDPVHVVCVTDESTGNEAMYIGGELKFLDHTIYSCDIARETAGLTFNLSHVAVDLPIDQEFPKKFEECVKWICDEGPLEEKIDYAADQMM